MFTELVALLNIDVKIVELLLELNVEVFKQFRNVTLERCLCFGLNSEIFPDFGFLELLGTVFKFPGFE